MSGIYRVTGPKLPCCIFSGLYSLCAQWQINALSVHSVPGTHLRAESWWGWEQKGVGALGEGSPLSDKDGLLPFSPVSYGCFFTAWLVIRIWGITPEKTI